MTPTKELRELHFKDTMARADLTEKDLADRKALARQLLDEWMDVTGAIGNGSSWYYELCAIIEDAVEIGMLGEPTERSE